MKFGVIYKITNRINGKCYIGQTVQDINIRFNAHCREVRHGMAITKAIIKYGRENFTIEEVFTAFSQEALNNLESYFIEELNSLSPNGYNLCGGGGKKSIVSEETRKKLSNSHKGHTQNRGRKQTFKTRFSNSDQRALIGIEIKTNRSTIYSFLNEVKDYGLDPVCVREVLSGKRKHHKGIYFVWYDNSLHYANQSGSEENKGSLHAPRLDGETGKPEYNPSTRPQLPTRYRGNISLDEIVKRYNNGEKLYQIAEEFHITQAALSNRLKRNGYKIVGRKVSLNLQETVRNRE